MKKTILLQLCLITCLFSCRPSDDDTASDTSYALEIVDSVQVDFLGNLQLYAVHATRDLFLFHEFRQKKLILTNQNGKVLSSFDQPADSPISYGNTACAATFVGDSIVVMGKQKLVIYDLNFDFIKSHQKPYAGQGMTYSGYDHLQKANIAGETNLVAFTGGAQYPAFTNEEAYYNHFNTFDLINLDSGGYVPITPLHPKSRYKQGKAFNFIRPMFQVDEDRVHFIFATDTLFHTHDLSKAKNGLTVEGIPFDDFILNPGYPFGGSEDYDTPKPKKGEIESYFKVNEKDLILYRSGLSLENAPTRGTASREEWNEINARLNPLKFLVREAEGIYSEVGLCPTNFTPTHVDGKNQLWARQHVELLDQEPEFYTIYQVALVPQ
ncbi:hypothetical protein [uncultured Cyclobacterium sp.]|uniref:hypothetical protein n=1 Tax=uncultured Cyclobacterium sp. TaxID=453820 RepID=UPI0030EB7A23|tara:strand:- start:264478 stop:265620 length:1143 start_codon:yes stop_codon:yes gene_type:complete